MLKGMDQLWLQELSTLNEVQKRRFAALKAMELGWGGVTKVSEITKMSHNTIDKGIKEIKNPKKDVSERLRKKGGGRRPDEQIKVDK